jgi:hypothetical protein
VDNYAIFDTELPAAQSQDELRQDETSSLLAQAATNTSSITRTRPNKARKSRIKKFMTLQEELNNIDPMLGPSDREAEIR